MTIIFSSSVRMAAEFAETISQRDDVWKVKCTGLDVSCVSSSSRALHKLAQDFERAWLERKIAEAEAALKASAPVASAETPAEVREENFEEAEILVDPVVPLAVTVGLNPEGYLLGIEDGVEEEKESTEDFEDGKP